MKYKLIKEYPSSPKLNTIVIWSEGRNCYMDTSDMYPVTSDKKIIENYPEFWQEVVEKDYEILSYIYVKNNTIITKRKNGLFLNSKTERDFGNYPEIIYKNSIQHIIHSVKRLSDGEIFTIGDKVNNGLSNNCIIDKLYINDNKLIVDMCENGLQYLNYIKKAKTPLFTTEDGVDIFEGDEFYFLAINWLEKFHNHYGTLTARIGVIARYAYKRFSTKEKAEEYILMNKPCLSYGDVQEYLKVKDCNKVLDLVQSKIQQSV